MHAHTNNHTTDYTNFNNVQTYLFKWTRLVHQLWVTEKRYLVYQLVEEFVASARWTVRHKEVPAGNTDHLFRFHLNYLADSWLWLKGH